MATAADTKTQHANKTRLSKFLQKYNSEVQELFASPEFYKELKEFSENYAKRADKEISKEYNDTVNSNAQETLSKFSEDYKTFFLNFLKGYQKWKNYRKKLIKKSTSYANILSVFSRVVSTVRIVTSITNIFGTLELFPQFTSFWGHPSVINSPAIALGFIIGESLLSSHYQKKTKEFIEKDEDVYKNLTKWFDEAKKLDGAVNILFPKGIDKELVKKIDRQSIVQDGEPAIDESTKLLASIFASNTKDNVSLLENKDFIANAVKFATSKAGIQWFHKTILEMNPVEMENFKLNLSQDMTDSDTKKANVSLCTVFSPIPTLKLVLNGVTLLSGVLDLLESDCDDSRLLRKLSLKANEDFETTKGVLKFLCPSDIDITNELD